MRFCDSHVASSPRKDNNWRTLVINANSIANKKAELAAIAEYCDPDLMLFSETKLSSDILNGEFVPEGYMGRFRKDRKRGAGESWSYLKNVTKLLTPMLRFKMRTSQCGLLSHWKIFIQISCWLFLSPTWQRYLTLTRPGNRIGSNLRKI